MAKFQVFKWGIGRFVVQGEIRKTTEAAKKMRDGLQKLWDLASSSDFLKYIGNEDKELVVKILKTQKVGKAKGGDTPPAKREAGSEIGSEMGSKKRK